MNVRSAIFVFLLSLSLPACPMGSQETAVASQGSAGSADTVPYAASQETVFGEPDAVVARLQEWQGMSGDEWRKEVESIESALVPLLHSPLLVWSSVVQALDCSLLSHPLSRGRALSKIDPTGDFGAILAARSSSPCAFEARISRVSDLAVAEWQAINITAAAAVAEHLSSLDSDPGYFLSEVPDGTDLVLACKQVAGELWNYLGKEAWQTAVADLKSQRGDVFERMQALARRSYK